MTSEREPGRDDGEDIGGLIRLAGLREPVPEARAARARQAAHDVWRGAMRRRARIRFAWTGAVLAAAASVVILLAYRVSFRAGSPVAGVGGCGPIELVAGEADLREMLSTGLTAPRALASEASVPLGSALITYGSTRAAIRLPSGHSLRLDLDSQVRIVDPETLHLDRGALYLSSPSSERTSRPLTVETPVGLIREIGTQFEIRLEGEGARVRVREGAVHLDRDGMRHEVTGGRELALAADGTLTESAISTYGEEWEWVTGITPMLDLHGQTARVFLGWVAREQGWALEWAGPDAEEASGAVVAGDLQGMTMTQALDAVLPSCSLAYEVEEGVLKVGRAP